MGHWYVHADSSVKSPQWLHHLQFSWCNAFWPAPELSVGWLSWMSLPNKLKCSHTLTTLKNKGDFTLHEPQFLCYVPCGLVRPEWERRHRYTTDSWLSVSHVQIFFFPRLFTLKTFCSKRTVTMFSEWLNASFLLVGAALTFLPI